ncbi:MAG: aryl-sulfate sulfotransferase, partial [Bacteroidia bacterium]|nr:aryl-sulfate sulfotransferase [Bacteroidia bacterium]
MMNRLSVIALMSFFALLTQAQEEGGVLLSTNGNQPGYILFAPLQSKITYLIDKEGHPVHSWRSKWLPAQSAYLLPDGNLLRTGIDTGNKYFPRSGGWIEKIDTQDRVVWSYLISNKNQRRHHDVFPMANGNILVLVWERKTAEQARKAGRDPAALDNDIWTEKIIEIKPEGTNSAKIVWQWNAWDHLVQDFDKHKKNYGVISQSPQLFNINFQATKDPDWLHFNAISYNAQLDQIIVNSRNFCEFYVIDHSTSTEEAGSHKGGKYGHGGDILYRWGNPKAYNRGTENDQKFFSQHNAHWIESNDKNPGKIMVFNNGLRRPEGEYSS